MLAPLAGNAQKQFYHNVGDTITNLDTIYWRPAWFDKITRPDTSTDFCMDRLQFSLAGAGEILMKCYTDKPLQVIGIATSVYILNEVETYDTLRRPEQVRLYQAYPGDSLELKLAFWYDLYDLRGNRLLQQEAQGVSTTLEVGHLPQGIYIVLVHNQQGTSTKKLILQ